MEKKYFVVPGYWRAILQIGQNYSKIRMKGNHVYGVCGQNAILYLVDCDYSVVGLRLTGGYISRIKTSSYDEWFHICVEYFNPQPCHYKFLKDNFSYEWVDVL